MHDMHAERILTHESWAKITKKLFIHSLSSSDGTFEEFFKNRQY